MAQDLLENGYVTGRPYMGITYLAVTDAQTAAQLGVNAYGIYVVDVVSGGLPIRRASRPATASSASTTPRWPRRPTLAP